MGIFSREKSPAAVTTAKASDIDGRNLREVDLAGDPAQSLALPIVLPQTTKSRRGAFFSPFVRAYVKDLAAVGISETEFVACVDGLNECWVGHPIFQGVSIAGGVLGSFYGMNSVEYVGMGLQWGAGFASAATSYARTRAYVKAMNAKLFNPVGLRMRIRSTKKLIMDLGYPEDKLQLPYLDTFDDLQSTACGKSTSSGGTELERASSTSSSSSSSASSSSSSEDEKKKRKREKKAKKRKNKPKRLARTLARRDMGTRFDNDPRTRRMKALDGYVMPLDFNVPDSVPPDNLLRRMGQRQAEKLERKQERRMLKKRAKMYKKAIKEQRKIGGKEGPGDEKVADLEQKLERMEAKLDSDLPFQPDEVQERMMQDFREKEEKLQKEISRESERRDVVTEAQERALEKHKSGLDKQETKVAHKLRWIVIGPTQMWNDDASGEADEVEDEDE